MEQAIENNIVARVDVLNSYDEALNRQGLLAAESVRRVTLNAGMNSACPYLSMPKESIDALGLLGFNLTEPDDAEDGSRVVQKVFGPATLIISGHSHDVLAIASPPGAITTLGYFSLDDSFDPSGTSR
ncbi:MAG: hypothetical protein WCT04_01630 [Planctomycetota bacterium]